MFTDRYGNLTYYVNAKPEVVTKTLNKGEFIKIGDIYCRTSCKFSMTSTLENLLCDMSVEDFWYNVFNTYVMEIRGADEDILTTCIYIYDTSGGEKPKPVHIKNGYEHMTFFNYLQTSFYEIKVVHFRICLKIAVFFHQIKIQQLIF